MKNDVEFDKRIFECKQTDKFYIIYQKCFDENYLSIFMRIITSLLSVDKILSSVPLAIKINSLVNSTIVVDDKLSVYGKCEFSYFVVEQQYAKWENIFWLSNIISLVFLLYCFITLGIGFYTPIVNHSWGIETITIGIIKLCIIVIYYKCVKRIKLQLNAIKEYPFNSL